MGRLSWIITSALIKGKQKGQFQEERSEDAALLAVEDGKRNHKPRNTDTFQKTEKGKEYIFISGKDFPLLPVS